MEEDDEEKEDFMLKFAPFGVVFIYRDIGVSALDRGG